MGDPMNGLETLSPQEFLEQWWACFEKTDSKIESFG
jgi:hypothetical protein